jgi:cytoskeleton protein RodZ
MKKGTSMSEEAVDFSETPAPQSPIVKLTAGALLKAARERAGLHVAALAVSMKVPVKKLEALESDRLDLLPDAVFVRALAASVCRTLKIDSAPVLDLLPTSAPPRLSVDDRGINTPFDMRGRASSVSLASLLKTPPALMVAALLLAAVAVYFYPESSVENISNSMQAVAPEVNQAPPVPMKQASATPESASSVVSSDVVAALPSAPVTGGAVNLTGASNSVNPTEVPKLPASSAEASFSNLLQFKVKGNAWVQVTDAKGVQLISRTLLPGEVIGVNGALPMAVVVGRVDLTTVELRGKPYDLNISAQSNVARFEVR